MIEQKHISHSQPSKILDKEQEFLNFEKLEPQQLTELGIINQQSGQSSTHLQEDISYTRLQQVPDQEQEFLNFDKLSPQRLTDLDTVNLQSRQLRHSNAPCSQEDIPYSRLLQMPDEEHEFSNIEKLGVQQLAEQQHHGSSNNSSQIIQYMQHQHQQQQKQHQQQEQQLYNNINLINSLNGDICSVFSGDMTHTTTNLDKASNISSSYGTSSRKRKTYYTTDPSDYEDDGTDSKSAKTVDDSKKQNHSEIEKRRRDKMNSYISEISTMVPMCSSMSRKLDRLTVLRMAVHHLKTIRGALRSYKQGQYKPNFLSDQELEMLLLQATDGFLFVLGCDHGKILYVSESVSRILNYSQGDLLGKNWFDFLHPKDVAKVKEQLSSELFPKDRLIDAKTMLPIKADLSKDMSPLCPGSRRSFFCSIRCESSAPTKRNSETYSESSRKKKQNNADKKYCVIQCTGYLKSWAPIKSCLEQQELIDLDTFNLSCLVAVGRIPPNVFQPTVTPTLEQCSNVRPIQFISRHTLDGKFLFVDQNATLILGYLPQELLGTSMYEYYQINDIPGLAKALNSTFETSDKVITPIYQFRSKDNGFISLQTEWKHFKNPWTKEVEYLIGKNYLILNGSTTQNDVSRPIAESEGINNNSNSSSRHGSIDTSQNSGNIDGLRNERDMTGIIDHMEAIKIGRRIAERGLEVRHRMGDLSSDIESSPDSDSHAPVLSGQVQSVENNNATKSKNSSNKQSQRLNGKISRYNSSPDSLSSPEVVGLLSNLSFPEPFSQSAHDEATMTVISNLLESDAGLGGAVNFSGFPWPLP